MSGSEKLLLLLANVAIAYSAAVPHGQPCSLLNNPCQRAVIKFRLENVINFTNNAIKILNDGDNCPAYPEDCEAIYRCGFRSSGVYTVWPKNRILKDSVKAYCDMETDGGGWTVIQRRGDFGRAKDYFYNDWNAYKEGFGDVSQDFWLGNDIIFAFTNQKLNSLRFDLGDLEGAKRWAIYDNFWIDSEEHNYLLHVRGYTGDAGDSFSNHNGKQFTTKDRDHDEDPDGNCAMTYKGAWWYARCHTSNLNGLYLNGTHTSFADGIEWKEWHFYNYSLSFTEMKIRPIFFRQDELKTNNVIPS